MVRLLFFLLVAFNFALSPRPAFAHAFGQLYTLPVPIWLYLYAGGAAIIVSFLIIGYFINQTKRDLAYPAIELKFKWLKRLGDTSLRKALSWISFSLFILTILTGLFGNPDPLLNFNMTFFWIVVLLGLTYSTAIFGNLYLVLNPWKIILEGIEKLTRIPMKGVARYPQWLSYYPGLVLYILLIWTELVSRVTPFQLSLRLLIYTCISFLVANIYGKGVWLKYWDVFGIFFDLISRLAVVEKLGNKWYLRPPFVGLLKDKAEHVSLVLFIIFMLSSTAFDGFHSTTAWFRIEFNYLDGIEQALGSFGSGLVDTVALILGLGIFFALFMTFLTVMRFLSGGKEPIRLLVLDFALSLVPIALAYNSAHYFTLLLIQGQAMISLVSDPFGVGWNLFGTASFQPNVGIVGANTVWNVEVGLILLGHIAAVYLAHLLALKTFPSRYKAVVGQLPMLGLMVFYTVAGLWILAQPLTGG